VIGATAFDIPSLNGIHTYVHIYVRSYMCVCVCVLVYMCIHTHTHMFYRSNTCHKTAECETSHDYTIDNTYTQIENM